MPKLLDQMREIMRRRRYSLRTEEAYIRWVKEFIIFNGKRHPRELREEEITHFLSHLAIDRKVAASTQNQALSALLFLYKDVLRQPIAWLGQPFDIRREIAPRRLHLVAGGATERQTGKRSYGFDPTSKADRLSKDARKIRSQHRTPSLSSSAARQGW